MRCIHCGHPCTATFQRIGTSFRLLTCGGNPTCGRPRDKYVEYQRSLLFLDLMLLRRKAYAHWMANCRHSALMTLAFFVLQTGAVLTLRYHLLLACCHPSLVSLLLQEALLFPGARLTGILVAFTVYSQLLGGSSYRRDGTVSPTPCKPSDPIPTAPPVPSAMYWPSTTELVHCTILSCFWKSFGFLFLVWKVFAAQWVLVGVWLASAPSTALGLSALIPGRFGSRNSWKASLLVAVGLSVELLVRLWCSQPLEGVVGSLLSCLS